MPLITVLAGLVACGTGDSSGVIVYVDEQAGGATLAAVDPTGAPIRLASVPGATFPAAPDPRGTHVLWVSTTDGAEGHRESLWIAPMEGGDPIPLAPPSGRVRNPAWAPGGGWIAFESDAVSFRDLYRIERDGSGLRRLTHAPHGSFEPSISPDGGRVAFASSRDGNAEIYVADADGARPTRRTDHPGDDVRPGWSPDGSMLTWIAHRDGISRVWRADATEGGDRPLRSDASPSLDLDYAWSPDGSRLVIVVQVAPRDIDLHVVTSEGAPIAVISAPGIDEHPAWSPDGRWLAFTSSRSGKPELWLASANGDALRQLTRGPNPAWLPRWLR